MLFSIKSDEEKVLEMRIILWFYLNEILLSKPRFFRLCVLKRKIYQNMANAYGFPKPRSFIILDITMEILGTSNLNMTKYQFNLRDKIFVLVSH